MTKRAGRQACWGAPLSGPRNIDDDISKHYSQEAMCHTAGGGGAHPYPVWIKYWKNCTAAVCDLDGKYGDALKCENLHCKLNCVNNNYASEECLNCGPCKSCNIFSLFNTGKFDRALGPEHKGGHQAIKTFGEFNQQDPARPALEPMSAYVRSMLPKGSCAVCSNRRSIMDCRASCKAYELHRMNGTVMEENAQYKLAFNMCRSRRCIITLAKRCSSCCKAAEGKAQLSYVSILGNSYFKQNYEGWGCPKDCDALQVAKNVKFIGAQNNRAAHDGTEGIASAFDSLPYGIDTLEENELEDLVYWAKNYKQHINNGIVYHIKEEDDGAEDQEDFAYIDEESE